LWSRNITLDAKQQELKASPSEHPGEMAFGSVCLRRSAKEKRIPIWRFTCEDDRPMTRVNTLIELVFWCALLIAADVIPVGHASALRTAIFFLVGCLIFAAYQVMKK
jgi:hypothetical protein